MAAPVSPLLAAPSLSAEDDRFLDRVERKAFEYFLAEHHPRTGLVKDKASNVGPDDFRVASIAATGFGLTAMCAGAERGWITKEEARRYCEKTLRFLLNGMDHEHGFFYHFVNWANGKKINHTEVSSIDTALLLAGALTAAEYFKGTEIETMAARLYERVDFGWMLNGGSTLSMGWLPRQGFLNTRWDSYNESLILYVLAAGSPSYPVPPESWHKVRKPVGVYGPHVYIVSPPLFTHQYSAVWLDLKDKNDGFADYFENSRVATLVNRQFCLDQSKKYRTYSEDSWGLTASVGPTGYRAYGAEPSGAGHDGTVAPTAAGSSIVFTPEFSIRALKFMYDNLRQKIWGRYGFADAYNLDREWFATEVLGIDQGPLMLMIENYRSGLIWRYFMNNARVREGMDRLGFKAGTLRLSAPRRPGIQIPRLRSKVRIDGNFAEWSRSNQITLDARRHHEIGDIGGPEDAAASYAFAWSPKFLYFGVRVTDNSLVMKRGKDKIWRDDCVELFLNPGGEGLLWKSPNDFQIGVSPGDGETGFEGRSWAWFQGHDPAVPGSLKYKVRRFPGGYSIEGRIAWKFFKLAPSSGLSFGLTPSLHDADEDGTEGKLTWYFLLDGKTGRIGLGRAVLE